MMQHEDIASLISTINEPEQQQEQQQQQPSNSKDRDYYVAHGQ